MLTRLNLRYRLFLSYAVLLLISLGVIAVALFLFLAARPSPPESTYERLAAVAQGLNINSLVEEFAPNIGRPIVRVRLTDLLADFAQTRGVRVMSITIEGERGFVNYDSAGVFALGDPINIALGSYTSGRLARVVGPSISQIYGSFFDPGDGTEWLFGGIGGQRSGQGFVMLILADPRPTVSLQETLSEFGSSLLLPILQAGCVGLLVAFVLAAVISRSIARPLQAVAGAAPQVAAGRYELRVPVTGPPEVRAVAEAFNRMSAEVRLTQQAQRDFLANVSHDLKTPLTSIQGYSQAIIDGTAKNPAHAAEIIHDEAERLNRMVVELTDLARIQAGRLSMKTAAVDIGQIAAAICQRLMVVAQKKQIRLHVHVTRMPDIAGDGDRLAQVLTNLISNAIKYTPEGGEIWVKTQVVGNGVEVIVQDTGIGIPAKDLPRIFERFYQVDKARGPERGTGLGLAIVKEIVQAHGGEIRVYSEGENKGTTFVVWLPSPYLSTVISRKRG